MKVIDLLNKIANGEIPKTIVYDEKYFTYDVKRQNYFDYDDSEIDWKYTVMDYINDEIEIIEDTPKEEKKIPEKINIWYEPIKDTKLERHDINTSIEILANMCDDLKDKYNEIIDYLKSKGE